MNPLPRGLGKALKQFKHVLVPELNLGQLRTLIRNRYLVDAKGLNKVKGLPFTIHEIIDGRPCATAMAGKVVPDLEDQSSGQIRNYRKTQCR